MYVMTNDASCAALFSNPSLGTYLPPGDPLCVLQRVLDPDVAVQRDGAQAQDGGSRAHHVRADTEI